MLFLYHNRFHNFVSDGMLTICCGVNLGIVYYSVCSLYVAADLDGTVLLAADSLEGFNNYQPSLHTLAELFLGNGARQLFKVIVLITL